MMSPQVHPHQNCPNNSSSSISEKPHLDRREGSRSARLRRVPTARPSRPLRLSMTLLLTAVLSAVLLLSWLPCGADAAPVYSGEMLEFESRHYCSEGLSYAMDMICGGRTNSLSNQYPNSVGAGANRTHRVTRSDDDVFYRPTNSGASHQCCQRPCGYSELRMYCAV